MKYPFIWGKDIDSLYKSLWLGWWLITWCIDIKTGLPVEISIRFQPSL